MIKPKTGNTIVIYIYLYPRELPVVDFLISVRMRPGEGSSFVFLTFHPGNWDNLFCFLKMRDDALNGSNRGRGTAFPA